MRTSEDEKSPGKDSRRKKRASKSRSELGGNGEDDAQTTLSAYENQIEEIKISPLFDINYVRSLESKNK